MPRRTVACFLALLLILAVSCSGSQSVTAPDTSVEPDTTPAVEMRSSQANTHILGLWDVIYDIEANTIEAAPLRSADFLININRFIDGPPVNLLIGVDSVDPQPDYLDLEVLIAIIHPLPGLDEFTVFDTMGIIYSTGTDIYLGDENFPVPGENDVRLLNPDGYTRWFNYVEFGEWGADHPFFGYYPGHFGSPDFNPSAVLNPYIYFTDLLDNDEDAFNFLVENPDNRGKFQPGFVDHATYRLRFPTVSDMKFQYAFVTHWEPNVNHPDPPVSLDDFPIEANASEALVTSVVDSSTLWYDNGISGGDLILDISPYDWTAELNSTGIMEEYAIRCWLMPYDGPLDVPMAAVDLGPNYYTFHLEAPIAGLTSTDPMPVWIEVWYPGDNWDNLEFPNGATGHLASYFKIEIPVSDVSPIDPWILVTSPNGGEDLIIGETWEINWESNDVTGYLIIEYSKDNFVADINPVASGVMNSGVFDWVPIPDDPSETVRIRITSMDNPSIFDDSDNDFTIKYSGPEPSLHLTRPNGGEIFRADGCQEITWESENVTGTVFLEYSKDNFAGDINPIDSDLSDTGSYYWDPIAYDLSETVRVRVCLTDDPSVYDISDDDFAICVVEGWVQTWGDSGNDRAYGICTDDAGNFYITGFYYAYSDFNPDPMEDDYHNGFGSWDSFVSKFDPAGDFIWAKTWGSTGYADSARDVAVDLNGNIFVTGWWQNDKNPPEIDLDPGPGVDMHYGTIGDNIYLIKLDSDGNYQWGYSAAGADWDFCVGTGVATDDFGDVYFAGYFAGNLVFDPGPMVLISHGGQDPFICKISSAGNYSWAYNPGGSGYDYAYDIDIDSSGNVLVTGSFSNSVYFDHLGAGDLIDSNGGADAFLTSCTSSAGYLWTKTWGGTSQDTGYGISVDSAGNILVAGTFGADVDFNPSGGDIHVSNGDLDAFISKFDPSGNFIWASTWGGPSGDVAYDCASDSTNAIGITGYFMDTVDFDPLTPGGMYSFTSHTNHDSYIVKLADDGAFNWAFAWGGEAQSDGGGVEDEGWGVVTDSDDNFYITGSQQNNCDFYPGCATEYRNADTNDAFFLKLLPDGTW